MKKTGKSILSIFLTLLLAALPLTTIPALAVIVAPDNVQWVTVPTSINGQEPAGLNPGDPWLDLAFYINGSGMDAAQEAAWLARNNSYVWQFDFNLNYVRVDHNDGTEEIFNRQSGWIMAIREAAMQPVRVYTNTAGLQVGDYYLDKQGYLDTLYNLFTTNGYAGLDRTQFDSAYSEFTYRYNPTGNICRWQMQGAGLPDNYTGGLYLPQYAIHCGGSLGQQMLWQCQAAEANIHVVTAADVANSPWVPIPTSPNAVAVGGYYLDFAGLSAGSTFYVTDPQELAILNGGQWYVDHAQGLVTGYFPITENDPTLGTYTVEGQIPENADLYANLTLKTCEPGSADPQDHLHAQTVAETAATATEHGYTAGVYCPDCDAWISGHEVIHNTLGAKTILAQPTVESEGEAIIVCTVCGERGLYAIEMLTPTEQPDDPGDGGFNPLEMIRRALSSLVNWMLRLIRWLGGK